MQQRTVHRTGEQKHASCQRSVLLSVLANAAMLHPCRISYPGLASGVVVLLSASMLDACECARHSHKKVACRTPEVHGVSHAVVRHNAHDVVKPPARCCDLGALLLDRRGPP